MSWTWFGRRAAVRENPVATSLTGAAPSTPDLRDAVQAIARQASTLGRNAAEVRGLIDDTTRLNRQQVEAVQALGVQLGEVQRAQAGIGSTTADSLQAVDRASAAVEEVAAEVGGIIDSLRQVAAAAGQITRIALQTRLVAFNATVEAGRAGEAGRGFAVVAGAVKDLSAQVEDSSKEIMRTVALLDARVGALAREIQRRDGEVAQGGFHRALAEVQAGVGRISSAADRSRRICDGLTAQMGDIQREMQRADESLAHANSRSEAFLKVGESLIEVVADCGVETDDTPFIRGAQQAAREIGRLLEESLAGGVISAADLFDENYQPIPGSNPPQHTTRFCALADALFPQVQERMLGLSSKVVYCIAADRNGYVPTHIRQYCQPQRPGDVVWNTANSRYRRIFNDRTGLASARNQRPLLLQTYRRDMGGGQFVLMKEAAAPIVVNGRHWGAVRLAFHF